MLSISKEQWLQIDPTLPIFYNASDDVIAIRPNSDLYSDEESIRILPQYVLQVDAKNAYILCITDEGVVTEYPLRATEEELNNYNAGPLLYALRKELIEVTISTNN